MLERVLMKEKLKVKDLVTIGVFSALHEERQAISDAMKLRDVKGIVKKLEYIFIPLMLSASLTADELSQAITARGIDNQREKTCLVELKFNAADIVLCILSAGLIIFTLVL